MNEDQKALLEGVEEVSHLRIECTNCGGSSQVNKAHQIQSRGAAARFFFLCGWRLLCYDDEEHIACPECVASWEEEPW